jgi:hypothetical protein
MEAATSPTKANSIRNGRDLSILAMVSTGHAARHISAAGHKPLLIGRAQFHSSSASRVTAGAAGFLTFSQQSARPDRYGDPSRFDTMPSQPSALA